eukprot:Gb_38304 [translate_table: standard]
MGSHWHDPGSIWFYCSLQWFLANCCGIFTEDTCAWLAIPTAVSCFTFHSLSAEKSASVTWDHAQQLFRKQQCRSKY